VTLAALLAACGGSSPSSAGGSGTANLFLKGTISAREAGAVVVNGVRVSTPPTARIEKVERPESELELGMVVKVKAHGNGGRTAEGLEIEFEDAVKGKVEAKDATTLSVGGATVRVDDSTEFEDNGGRLGSIAAGERVRVSGVPDDRGGLRATRIDKDPGTSDDFEVKGFVSGLSASGFTLKTSPDAGPADAYTVTLAAGATIPAGVIDGSFVEVRSTGPVQAGNVIVAASISLEDDLPGESGQETEVEGIVTSGTSAMFVVAGTTVVTSASTRWSAGIPDDLVPGVKVEAEGVLGADGVLSAEKVSFRYNVKLQGAVAGLQLAGDGSGTLTVNGLPVTVDLLTDQRDGLSAMEDGDLVELRGFSGRDGASVVATRIELRNDDRPIIQGPVQAADEAAGWLHILGKTIATDGSTEYRDTADAALTRAAFYAGVTVGETVVKARGRDPAAFSDPVLTARELELEGDR
jgi:hypothetical protein